MWKIGSAKALDRTARLLFGRTPRKGMAIVAPGCFDCDPRWANVGLLCRKHLDASTNDRRRDR